MAEETKERYNAIEKESSYSKIFNNFTFLGEFEAILLKMEKIIVVLIENVIYLIHKKVEKL